MAPASESSLVNEPGWPSAQAIEILGAPSRVVFLLDASSKLERKLLLSWIDRNRPSGWDEALVETIDIPPTRRRRRVSLEPLQNTLASPGQVLLAPLRVAWLPRKRDGEREARFSDVLRLGDPRDPGVVRQHGVLRREADRCRIVAGDPATASELRDRWRNAGGAAMEQDDGLADFVSRQAVLALERAERQLRGARYKVPRLVHEDVLRQPAFVSGIKRLADELGTSEKRARRDAAGYLREIAATHSTFVIDLVAQLIRLLYTRGYSEALHYDRDKLERVQALAQKHSVVFLPTHKSNLDHLVLQYMLHENGHPPNHTAGGINMNFFPLGPLVRRSGVFFIRRTFKDNPVYKFVLRNYVDYLIEKRFSLEWYIEGGRSRSGKLLPPRFGMLAYVVDAYLRGKADDVVLIPVSIAYDQITDVHDYAAEQTGAAKQKESLSWFVGIVRRLGARYGDIHITIGDPLSLAKALGPADPNSAPNPDTQNLALQKLAFEVCVRINEATPITAASLVTLALLGAGEQACTVDEVRLRLISLLDMVKQRDLPTAEGFSVDTNEKIESTLLALEENGVTTRFSEGSDCVYRIGPDQQLAASYYRNSIIHFFLNPAITELSLLAAAEDDTGDRIAAFWRAAMQLRDLLKFEFFFAEKDAFRAAIQREIAEREPRWEETLNQDSDAIHELVRRWRPLTAHRVLRPFLEAYRIVADQLERADSPVETNAFLESCTGLGRQYHLQRRIRSTASISSVLFKNALQLAANRGLLKSTESDLLAWRRIFADEVRTAIRRIDAIDALAASRRAGLID